MNTRHICATIFADDNVGLSYCIVNSCGGLHKPHYTGTVCANTKSQFRAKVAIQGHSNTFLEGEAENSFEVLDEPRLVKLE